MEPIVLHSGKRIVTSPMVLDKQLDFLIDTIRERHITFNRNLSGLVLDEISKSDLQLVEVIPLAGLKFRELPHFLAQKQAIINVKNTDNRCFEYKILSAIQPRVKNPQRPFYYDRFCVKEGLDQLLYPVTHGQIPTIEDKLKICINLFIYWDEEGKARTPISTFPRSPTQTQSTFSTGRRVGPMAPTTKQAVVLCLDK